MERAMTDRSEYAGGALILERTDGVARVIFNRPERLNAMSLNSWEGLVEVMDTFGADRSLRVVTLEGAGGRSFVSGADISEFDTIRSNPDTAAHYDAVVHAALEGIATLPVPSLALIDGYCIGGGLEIALSCDIRIASETAVFALTPAKLGLGYSYYGIELIERVAGAATAADLLFSGRRVKADEAHALGLCERVYAAEGFDEASLAAVVEIAANAPLTIRSAKAALLDLRKPPSDRNREHVNSMIAACTESDDYREGRSAFAQKRRPEFKGC